MCDMVISNKKLFKGSQFFKPCMMKSRISLVLLFILCGLVMRKNFFIFYTNGTIDYTSYPCTPQ